MVGIYHSCPRAGFQNWKHFAWGLYILWTLLGGPFCSSAIATVMRSPLLRFIHVGGFTDLSVVGEGGGRGAGD
jgi:hypothetical protein